MSPAVANEYRRVVAAAGSGVAASTAAAEKTARVAWGRVRSNKRARSAVVGVGRVLTGLRGEIKALPPDASGPKRGAHSVVLPHLPEI